MNNFLLLDLINGTIQKPITTFVFSEYSSRDIENYKDILKFRKECGTTSVMIARAAEWNVSVFRNEGT